MNNIFVMDDNTKRRLVFVRVPLEQLIKTLMDMYEAGAEFIDIMDDSSSSLVNSMGIIVQEEYLAKDIMGSEEFMENIKMINEENSIEEYDEENEEGEDDEYNPKIRDVPKMDLGDIIDGSI